MPPNNVRLVEAKAADGPCCTMATPSDVGSAPSRQLPAKLLQGSPCGLTPSLQHCSRFEGEIIWDTSNPEGQPRRMLDISKALREFGWNAKIPFEEGFATRSLGTRERSRSPFERHEL